MSRLSLNGMRRWVIVEMLIDCVVIGSGTDLISLLILLLFSSCWGDSDTLQNKSNRTLTLLYLRAVANAQGGVIAPSSWC